MRSLYYRKGGKKKRYYTERTKEGRKRKTWNKYKRQKGQKRAMREQVKGKGVNTTELKTV